MRQLEVEARGALKAPIKAPSMRVLVRNTASPAPAGFYFLDLRDARPPRTRHYNFVSSFLSFDMRSTVSTFV